MIRAGSYLRASGGFLVINANDALMNFGVWETLKRTVKNEEVRIEQVNDWGLDTEIRYLSIFARSALFTGPIPGNDMTLTHVVGSTHDDSGALIDRLCEAGALPNCGTASFTTVRGSWSEPDPNAPDPPFIP